jgi:hypothetical protein
MAPPPAAMFDEDLNEYYAELERKEEQIIAQLFLKKLNRTRYGPMLTELDNKLKMYGEDRYPATLVDAYDMALNRKDARYRPEIHNRINQSRVSNSDQNGVAFSTTSGSNRDSGPKVKGNPEINNSNTSESDAGADSHNPGGNKKGKCYFCKVFGHFKNECPMLKEAAKILQKDKKKCLVTFGEVSGVNDDDDSYDVENTFTTIGSSEIIAAVKRRLIEDGDILCDNQSSVSIFKDAKLLKNIRPAKSTMRVAGIGGSMLATQIGTFEGFGDVYYHPGSIANILCYHDIAQKFKVEYVREENLFRVSLPRGVVWDFKPKNKLYVFNPVIKHNNASNSDKVVMAVIPNNSSLVETVNENRAKYTKEEVKRADEARELWKTLAFPSTKDFIWMLKNGKVLGTRIAIHDVLRMFNIYGTDCSVLKGRVVRKQPDKVIIESIEREISGDLVVAVDIMFIDGVAFLVSISRRLQLIMVEHLANKSAEELLRAVENLIATYKAQSFQVVAIVSDGESGLKTIKPNIESMGIVFNPATKNELVPPEVERAIRLIKERIRILWNGLPFRLCDALLVGLVRYSVSMINMCPKVNSVNPSMPPREMFLGRKLDVTKECRLPFGAYVQTHDDNLVTNTMAPRTTGAISLGPTGSIQGSYRFLSLTTWRVITRRNWSRLPMPNEVIDRLNQRADRERSVSCLKGYPKFSIGSYDLDDDDDEQIDDNVIADGNGVSNNGSLKSKTIVPPIVPLIDEDAIGQHELGQDQGVIAEFDDSENINYQADVLIHPPDKQVLDQRGEVHDAVIEASNDTSENLEFAANHETDPPTVRFGELLKTDQAMDEVEDFVSNQRYHIRPKRSTWRDKYKEDYIVMTTLSVQQGLKELGTEAIISMMKELDQLHTKGVFLPVYYHLLTPKQKVKVLRSLMFLKRKRCGKIKSRFVADGSKQKREECIIDISSPTVAIESIFIIAAIAAGECRVVVTVDVEGAYLHCLMVGEVFIEMDSVIASILCAIVPEYQKYLYDGKLCLQLVKALYGCIESARLFYEHVSGTVLKFGFVQNPYDKCVFNKICYGKQRTVTIYVDDLEICCEDPRGVSDLILIFELKRVYKIVNVLSEKKIDYLGMIFDYEIKGIVRISMETMVNQVVEDWDKDDKLCVKTPATAELFQDGDAVRIEDMKQKEMFHSVVAKLLYIAKRARPDILLCVNFLATRVKEPTNQDWKKLDRVIKYLRGSKQLCLTLRANKLMEVHAYVDASYAIHPDAKGHSGMAMFLGAGSIYCKSSKQKLVARSSTEAELIGVSDGLTQILWTRLFLEAQGYPGNPVVMHQDNKSTIVLAKKGRSNVGKTKHINVRYFLVKDKVESQEVVVVHTPTEEMVADFFTKPLQGSTFEKLRSVVMGDISAVEEVAP